MFSSTASAVDPHEPTLFRYRQHGSLIWGEYSGDTVAAGRFVGEMTDDRIEIDFAHALVENSQVVRGSATSVVERRDDGLIYLIEDFEKDGRIHRSICVQVL